MINNIQLFATYNIDSWTYHILLVIQMDNTVKICLIYLHSSEFIVQT